MHDPMPATDEQAEMVWPSPGVHGGAHGFPPTSLPFGACPGCCLSPGPCGMYSARGRPGGLPGLPGAVPLPPPLPMPYGGLGGLPYSGVYGSACAGLPPGMPLPIPGLGGEIWQHSYAPGMQWPLPGMPPPLACPGPYPGFSGAAPPFSPTGDGAATAPTTPDRNHGGEGFRDEGYRDAPANQHLDADDYDDDDDDDDDRALNPDVRSPLGSGWVAAAACGGEGGAAANGGGEEFCAAARAQRV